MNSINELNRLLKNHQSYAKADRRFPAMMFHPLQDKIRVENQIQADAAMERGFSFDDPANGADHPHANDEARKKFLERQSKQSQEQEVRFAQQYEHESVPEPAVRRVGRPKIPRVE